MIGYATVDGERVALSSARTTRGREVASAFGFADLNTNAVHDAQSFFDVGEQDRVHVQLVLRGQGRHRDVLERPAAGPPPAGRHRACPRTAPASTSGAGSSTQDQHPHGTEPQDGAITNWNNKPAAGWQAADDKWAYGSMHREQLLHDAIDRQQTHTLGVRRSAAMNRAATQDLRDGQGAARDLGGARRRGRRPNARDAADARPARGLARAGLEPARPRPRRHDRRPGRGDHGQGLAEDRRRGDGPGARARSWATSRRLIGRDNTAEQPGLVVQRRLVRLRRQGPAHARRAGRSRARSRPGSAGRATWPPAATRCGRRSTQAGNELEAEQGTPTRRTGGRTPRRSGSVPPGFLPVHDALDQPARRSSRRSATAVTGKRKPDSGAAFRRGGAPLAGPNFREGRLDNVAPVSVASPTESRRESAGFSSPAPRASSLPRGRDRLRAGRRRTRSNMRVKAREPDWPAGMEPLDQRLSSFATSSRSGWRGRAAPGRRGRGAALGSARSAEITWSPSRPRTAPARHGFG